MPTRLLSFLLLTLGIAPVTRAAETVTFNHDIAPLLYRHCASCHRPGEAAPFPLLSYADATRKGKTIAKATATHLMPPWKAEPASYAYRDERRLSATEIALIGAWLEQGMPEGTGPKPEPPKFPAGWQLGEPDLIVELPASFPVPADGPDIYRNFAVALGLTEDRWVTAIDMRPTARAAVHHVLYFADPTGRLHQKPAQGAQPGFSGMRAGGASVPLGGWAIGAQPHLLPDGLALQLPKGSDLVIQYHFHPTGKPETEKSRIGLYFAKQPPGRTLTRIQMPPAYSLFSGLDIPAGEKDFVIRDSYVLPVAAEAIGAGAHAHYIGKRLKMTATFPDGEVKTLLSIADWDFAWQDRYFFQQAVPLPAQTKLEVEIHWDNSAENPRNPSQPPTRVTWGEESKDEMGSISLLVVPKQEAEIATLREDMTRRRNELARTRLRADPELAGKLKTLLAE
ncbi:MAG TPA: hypothetical protein VNH84_08450 [Candidatus Saccharimonadales bacterium]|nr:hypothetical protein [Candidatus Saccharimonadales bacterium]